MCVCVPFHANPHVILTRYTTQCSSGTSGCPHTTPWCSSAITSHNQSSEPKQRPSDAAQGTSLAHTQAQHYVTVKADVVCSTQQTRMAAVDEKQRKLAAAKAAKAAVDEENIRAQMRLESVANPALYAGTNFSVNTNCNCKATC